LRALASAGTASLVTAPDVSRGELYYRWPQVLPDGPFQGGNRETSGLYAASLSKPSQKY